MGRGPYQKSSKVNRADSSSARAGAPSLLIPARDPQSRQPSAVKFHAIFQILTFRQFPNGLAWAVARSVFIQSFKHIVSAIIRLRGNINVCAALRATLGGALAVTKKNLAGTISEYNNNAYSNIPSMNLRKGANISRRLYAIFAARFHPNDFHI